MIPKLRHYQRIIGQRSIEHIRDRADPLRDKHVVHVNATSQGGGVAEMLNNLVFLKEDIGIHAGWRVLLGSHSFFKVTKGVHNALQGDRRWRMTPPRQKLYLEYCERNGIINHISKRDFVVIHDPQPLGMIERFPKRTGSWFWRCHIDLTRPNQQTMGFLRPFIKQYDGLVVSNPKFKIPRIKVPTNIIHPSIDPLSQKNKHIGHAKAKRLLSKYGVDTDKPILLQVSRFDPWKGHGSLLQIYEQVAKQEKCQLVLMGDMANDDPEGPQIYHKIQQKAEQLPGITLITEKNDLLVNALQHEAAIVYQNSVKEGFGLTVSEALWKKTPVIGTRVGGIPLQIKQGRTGYLIKDKKEGAAHTLKLLRDEKLRRKLGEQGHQHVKENFLITRHLLDYIELFRSYEKKRMT